MYVKRTKNVVPKYWDLVVNLEEDEENCKFVSSLKYKKIVGFIFEDNRVVATSSAKEWFDMSALGKNK